MHLITSPPQPSSLPLFLLPFLELLLLLFCIWADLQPMLYDVFTDSYQVGGRPCKYVTVFVKETQQLRLLILACLHAYAYGFVRNSGVQQYSLKLTLSLYNFPVSCRTFCLTLI
jgi:hypothetical protein